jgi:hypothetical protein
VAEWFSIEVFDGEFSARAWMESHGDELIYLAQLYGASDWGWHHHRWGLVLELELPDEFAWERFSEAPGTRAAIEAVPDPVFGLVFHRGRGGSAGSRQPRRPRPFAGAGAVALPLPEDVGGMVDLPWERVPLRQLTSVS